MPYSGMMKSYGSVSYGRLLALRRVHDVASFLEWRKQGLKRRSMRVDMQIRSAEGFNN